MLVQTQSDIVGKRGCRAYADGMRSLSTNDNEKTCFIIHSLIL